MTINKSQGQTFKKIENYLPQPVFSHGQLYVALSRVGNREGINIMVVNGWKETITDDSNGVILQEGVYTPIVVFKISFGKITQIALFHILDYYIM